MEIGSFMHAIAGIARVCNETAAHRGDVHKTRIEELLKAGIPEDSSTTVFRGAVVSAEYFGPLSGADILEIVGSALMAYESYLVRQPKKKKQLCYRATLEKSC